MHVCRGAKVGPENVSDRQRIAPTGCLHEGMHLPRLLLVWIILVEAQVRGVVDSPEDSSELC